MDRSLISRLVVIVVVVALAALWAYPPEEKISLGLDLQGGMHMVLQVETDDAIRAETDNTIDGVQRDLEEAGVEDIEVDRTSDTSFEIAGVPGGSGRLRRRRDHRPVPPGLEHAPDGQPPAIRAGRARKPRTFASWRSTRRGRRSATGSMPSVSPSRSFMTKGSARTASWFSCPASTTRTASGG